MRQLRMVLLILIFTVTGGSAAPLFAQRVSVSYDKTADFSKFKTYAWVRGTPVPDANLNIYIVSYADGILQDKGLRKVEATDANLLVAYDAAGDSTINASTIEDPTYAASGGVAPIGATVWTGASASSSNTRLIQKGQLAVQMLDRSTHKVVWNGTLAGALKEKRSDKLDQLNKGLTKLLDRYPPAPGQ